VAAELNLSETVFVRRIEDPRVNLRWFTRPIEVDFCGHATIAATHALWKSSLVKNRGELCFDSRSGELKVRSVDDEIKLNFSFTPPTVRSRTEGLWNVS